VVVGTVDGRPTEMNIMEKIFAIKLCLGNDLGILIPGAKAV